MKPKQKPVGKTNKITIMDEVDNLPVTIIKNASVPLSTLPPTAGIKTKDETTHNYLCSCGEVVKIISKPDNRVDPEKFVRGDYCKKCSKK